MASKVDVPLVSIFDIAIGVNEKVISNFQKGVRTAIYCLDLERASVKSTWILVISRRVELKLVVLIVVQVSRLQRQNVIVVALLVPVLGTVQALLIVLDPFQYGVAFWSPLSGTPVICVSKVVTFAWKLVAVGVRPTGASNTRGQVDGGWGCVLRDFIQIFAHVFDLVTCFFAAGLFLAFFLVLFSVFVVFVIIFRIRAFWFRFFTWFIVITLLRRSNILLLSSVATCWTSINRCTSFETPAGRGCGNRLFFLNSFCLPSSYNLIFGLGDLVVQIGVPLVCLSTINV